MAASESLNQMEDSFACPAQPDEMLEAFGEIPQIRKRACCEGECEDCGLEVSSKLVLVFNVVWHLM